MIIHNIGYNHCHDADFKIERPVGSGDNLLLLLKTPAIFTLNGSDVIIPENSLFIYRKGTPQFYRCLPKQTFSNDWIHFTFEGEEEKEFLQLGLEYETPVTIDKSAFVSFCIKSVSNELYSSHHHKQSNIKHYMSLMFNHVSEYLHSSETSGYGQIYEKLSSIRSKIYGESYQFFSVECTAHEIRMSKSNFQHLYKKYFGVSFMQDLINSRIERAQMLLIQTNLTSADISKQCGYNNFTHFTRQFKTYTGCTPIEYRNKNNPSKK